jgi:hypothetical protein
MSATAAPTKMTPITPATMGRATTSMTTMGRATAGPTHRATVGAPADIAPKQLEAWRMQAHRNRTHGLCTACMHPAHPHTCALRRIPWGGVGRGCLSPMYFLGAASRTKEPPTLSGAGRTAESQLGLMRGRGTRGAGAAARPVRPPPRQLQRPPRWKASSSESSPEARRWSRGVPTVPMPSWLTSHSATKGMALTGVTAVSARGSVRRVSWEHQHSDSAPRCHQLTTPTSSAG